MDDRSSGVGEVFKGADVGERLWLFFHRNRSLFLSIAAAIVLFFAISFFGGLYSDYKISQMRKEYAQLNTPEEKANFVGKYKGEKLAGVLSLALGDGHMASGNYAAAASEYGRACKILNGTILFPRATVSRAVAMYRLGDFDGAEKLLNAIIYDKKHGKVSRGNAAYALVAMLKDSENTEKLKPLAKDIHDLELPPSFEELIHEIVVQK